MSRWLAYYFNTNNLIFLGILIAGVVVMYICTIGLKTLRISLAEKKKEILWVFDGCLGPLMFFVLITSYSCAYSYLRVPVLSQDALERALGILLFIDVGWLVINLGKRGLIIIFKVLSQKVIKLFTFSCLVAVGLVIILAYYRFYSALIFSAIISVGFIAVVNEVTRIAPEIQPRHEESSPRRLIMTHIYIATSETDEAVKRALQAIKEAIEATNGAEKNPYASLAGFTPGAFDILIRYYITAPERIDEIKQEVNLAIIRKLREINIRLSES